MESESRLKLKTEYKRGAEKLIITIEGSIKIVEAMHTKMQWFAFKKGWTLENTTVLGKKKSKVYM